MEDLGCTVDATADSEILKMREIIHNKFGEHSFNPFLPTGQFLAPKLIILIKCLIAPSPRYLKVLL